jgi:hypothetical protein
MGMTIPKRCKCSLVKRSVAFSGFFGEVKGGAMNELLGRTTDDESVVKRTKAVIVDEGGFSIALKTYIKITDDIK